MSRHERFRELCAAWVLGALDGDEVAELERLLSGADPEMRRIHAELQLAADHLPMGAPPREPPTGMKERILAALPSRVPREDRGTLLARRLGLGRPRFALGVAAGLLAAAVGLGLLAAALDRALGERDQRIAVLQDEVAHRDQLLEVLQGREVTVVALDGLEINPRGYGRLVWDTQRQVALLQVANLPAPAEGHVYQLWIFPREGDPSSPGVLRAAAGGPESFYRVEGLALEVSQVRGILITLESAPGASRPSEAWYLGARL